MVSLIIGLSCSHSDTQIHVSDYTHDAKVGKVQYGQMQRVSMSSASKAVSPHDYYFRLLESTKLSKEKSHKMTIKVTPLLPFVYIKTIDYLLQ